VAPVTVSIGGRELVVRPLTVRGFEVVSGLFKEMEARGGGPFASSENVEATITVLTTALSRGNEGITAEWLRDELEIPAVGDLLLSIARASGLSAVAPGEGKSP
jgi:hypothetical protein